MSKKKWHLNKRGEPLTKLAKRVKKVIGYVDYKPFCEFRMVAFKRGELNVYFRPTVRDSESQQLVTLNGPSWTVEKGASEARIVNLLYHIAAEYEMHESREHFRVKGKKVFDPHTAIWPSRF